MTITIFLFIKWQIQLLQSMSRNEEFRLIVSHNDPQADFSSPIFVRWERISASAFSADNRSNIKFCECLNFLFQQYLKSNKLLLRSSTFLPLIGVLCLDLHSRLWMQCCGHWLGCQISIYLSRGLYTCDFAGNLGGMLTEIFSRTLSIAVGANVDREANVIIHHADGPIIHKLQLNRY